MRIFARDAEELYIQTTQPRKDAGRDPLEKCYECVLVEVRDDGMDVIVQFFEDVIVPVCQIRQEIFLAGDDLQSFHPEHEDDANE